MQQKQEAPYPWHKPYYWSLPIVRLPVERWAKCLSPLGIIIKMPVMVTNGSVVEIEWIQCASGPLKSMWYEAYAQQILAVVFIILIISINSEFSGEECTLVE